MNFAKNIRGRQFERHFLEFDVPSDLKVLEVLERGDLVHLSDPGLGGTYIFESKSEPFQKRRQWLRTIALSHEVPIRP